MKACTIKGRNRHVRSASFVVNKEKVPRTRRRNGTRSLRSFCRVSEFALSRRLMKRKAYCSGKGRDARYRARLRGPPRKAL